MDRAGQGAHGSPRLAATPDRATHMFEKDLLRDKRVLITGGGTGLGLSIGRRCVELGG